MVLRNEPLRQILSGLWQIVKITIRRVNRRGLPVVQRYRKNRLSHLQAFLVTAYSWRRHRERCRWWVCSPIALPARHRTGLLERVPVGLEKTVSLEPRPGAIGRPSTDGLPLRLVLATTARPHLLPCEKEAASRRAHVTAHRLMTREMGASLKGTEK